MPQLCPMLALAAAALVAAPQLALSQRVVVSRDRDRGRYEVSVRRAPTPSRDITMAVGTLHDGATDDDAPMASLRAGWRLRSWLRSELGVSYAMADAAAAASDENAHVLSTVVGLRAELPWPMVRPYAGAAVGLSGRFEDGDGGDVVRPTIQFPVGLRIPLTRTLALQAEVRWRFDEQPSGGSVVGREQTVGLGFAF